MEIYPFGHYHHHEIHEMMHHGLYAVRPHTESGEEVIHHLHQSGAMMAEIQEHGHLVGYLLDPRVPMPHMSLEHQQYLHELPGVTLGTAHFMSHGYSEHHDGYEERGEHHGGGYYGGGEHHGGLLHEIGDHLLGHHEERHYGEGHHGGHHGEGHHGEYHGEHYGEGRHW